jgi:HEAT repeat protein
LLRKSGEQGARQLGERLAEEKEAKRRKILAQALTAFGRSALATLDRLLRDERWYVVRNAATILGEIRDPETAGRLAALLGHKDERVRREAIRALTRLGTTEAMDVLLVAVEEGDPDLQRQALLSLGAMKQTKAIPYLLRFLERSDPFVRCLELKRGAVRALGDMGAAEAVPALRALLQQRKFFFRRRFQEIQIACCLALARIGTDECRRVLEITTQHGHGPLSRSAARALREIARAEKS